MKRLYGFETAGLRDRLNFDYPDGEVRATGWLDPWEWRVLMDAVGSELGCRFKALAFQAYRDGTATTPLHRDEYAHQAMLSIGATRTFLVDGDTFPVADGDIIYLTDREEHAVLPDPDVTAERCSLVFRS